MVNMPVPKVLVTGASGFIGGRVVERLALEGKCEVRALVHQWSRAARVAKFPIEIVAGDITSQDDVATAMRGVTHVVHCAVAGDSSVIVDGTRTLLHAALEAGVTRFVHVSTAEVYGAGAVGEVNENAPMNECGRAYGDAKIQAEAACRETQERGISTAIVRPAIVYGPFGSSWTIDIAAKLESGLWSEFEGYGDGWCNAVYVDDLVSAIRLAAFSPAADGQAFNVNGGEIVTWNEYFRRMNDAMGLPALSRKSAGQSARRTAAMSRVDGVIRAFVRRFEDPLMTIYLRGGAASRVMKRVKTVLNSTPSPSELGELYCRNARYSDQKARDVLGYRPQFDLQRGLALSVLWMCRNGYLERPLDRMDAKPAVHTSRTEKAIEHLEPASATP
jgi:nucleoside-diphosphate-sugar epimerase